jgi:hypothetical protein
MKNSKGQTNQIWVKKSNGDVTSGPARPLEFKIDIPPIAARGKPFIASKQYKIEGKCC